MHKSCMGKRCKDVSVGVTVTAQKAHCYSIRLTRYKYLKNLKKKLPSLIFMGQIFFKNFNKQNIKYRSRYKKPRVCSDEL